MQLAFLRKVCGRLPVGIPAAAIFAELAEVPCSLKWRVQLVGFALRISDLPQGALHREILADNVRDALAKPSSANWAAQNVKHVRSLGLPAPFAHDGTVLFDKSSFRRHAAGKSHEGWQGLHCIEKGVLQGNTLSPFLCKYFMEPLAGGCKLREGVTLTAAWKSQRQHPKCR